MDELRLWLQATETPLSDHLQEGNIVYGTRASHGIWEELIFRSWLELGLECTGTFSSPLTVPIPSKDTHQFYLILLIAARGAELQLRHFTACNHFCAPVNARGPFPEFEVVVR